MKYVIFLFLLLVSVTAVAAQRGDYLTRAEQDVVRNNQDIDVRIAVLSYMIDRRFAAMSINSGGTKPTLGPEDDWGPEPNGSKPEMLFDIRHLLEKAIDDIDNIASRLPEKKKEERKGVNLFNSAVKNLNAAAKRWLPILKKEFEAADDEQTHSAAATSIGLCEQIIEAAAKLK
jgi:hypothetical protein